MSNALEYFLLSRRYLGTILSLVSTKRLVQVLPTSAVICALLCTPVFAAELSVFPGVEWQVERAEQHGLNTDKLNEAARAMEEVGTRYGFLVVKGGVIVHETYFDGDKDTTYPIYSVTKSFGSTLIGIAATQQLLRINDKIAKWLPGLESGVVEGATIEHALSMTAGVSPPGSHFAYTSGPALNSLPRILRRAYSRSSHEFYKQELASPIGLSMEWPHQDDGSIRFSSHGVEATHRDLARLGLLWLNRGNWNGKRLISEKYVAAALKPPFPEANNAYGYLWWLNTEGGTWRTASGNHGEGKLLKNASASSFFAFGAQAQGIFVIPDHDMVVVTLGSAPPRKPITRITNIIAGFLQ